MAKSAAKGQALAAMMTPSFQPLQHPFKLEFKNEDVGGSPVLNNPNCRERQSEHARFYPRYESSCVNAPRVSESVANEADHPNSRDDFQQEAMVLHRQQTALQVQQNRIVELLAVNQNKSKLPQPRVPIFDGNPVDYRSFVRAFESLIESRTQSSTERLYYLEQYTAGDVKELIRSCHHSPPDEGYEEARRLLKRKFGDEYRIASAYESKALGWPPTKPEDGSALSKFAIFLSSCKNALASSQYASKFDQPGNIQKLIFKLPFRMRERWRRHVDYIMELQSRPVNFSDLVAFVDQEARIATNPVFGDISDKTQSSSDFRSRRAPQTSPGFKPPKPKTSTFATQLQSSGDQNSCGDAASANVQPSLCLFCQKNHALEDCHLLRRKPYQERITFLASKRLCFGCLSDKHVARSCPERKACKFPNCTRKHPTVLHTSSNRDKCLVDVSVGTEDSTEAPVLNGMVNTDKCLNGNQEARRRTAMAVIPVKVRSKENNKSVITYAFLDNGSSATFCTESLMKQLEVDGAKVKISLSTLEKKNSPVDSYLIRDLVVSDLDENDFVNLPILYTRPEIPVNVEDIPTQEDVDRWPYLHDVFIPHVDAEIGLLIASDVPEALDPVEMRHSQDGGPYASRTRIGWAVNGPLGRCRKGSQTSGFFVKVDPQLQFMVENFYNHGFADTFADDTTEMSQEERRFMQNAEKIQFKFGHYEIPLPFKNPEALVPNNKSQALSRVGWLKKRLEKDSKLSDDYRAFMSDLLAKGYARKVPPVQASPDDGKAWYIPHHGVYHPHKPDKIRVVFNCSAKFKGLSLNSMLHKGPDLTNSLVGVLTRFREDRVAVMADIEAMFYQVRVPDRDSSSLRFLWWEDGDMTREVQEYQMLVHLFGAISSPACANFALRRTAEDNESCFPPEVINTVKRNFYVDDCLKSLPSDAAAIAHVTNLQALLSRGSFKLTKWVSNSRKVLQSIPESERSTEFRRLDLYRDELPAQRALGIRWCVESDTFAFDTCIKPRPPTRRGILSVVSSVFDPLGFVSPFVLVAKQALQDLCRIKFGWDDEVPPEYSSSWEKWLNDLPKLSSFSVDRSVIPEGFGPVISSQLHHFSDASEVAYGSVSYLRLVNEEGRVHCTFLFAKSRLAPLKSVSIPRLELSAATLSVRQDKREIEMPLSNASVFWTDSMSVLRYVKNENRRFHTFVANRIALIRDSSSPDQWYHVEGTLNPGDHTSRGLTAEALLNCERWLLGPEFSWKSECQWRKEFDTSLVIQNDDPEVKPDPVVKSQATSLVASAVLSSSALADRFQKFSSWHRLKKSIAWILRYRNNLLMATKVRKVTGQPKSPDRKQSLITIEEMKNAEKAILKIVQQAAYPMEFSELGKLRSGKGVKRSSPLFRLDPILKDGLLCVGGRLARACIPPEAKHQIILPKSSHISDLIVDHYHKLSGHSGRQHVLSMIHQKYWIIKANSTVRRVLTDCHSCRRREAPFCEQKMADLPEERLVPDKPPFTTVGVDCFGPFQVRRCRSLVKRYGVIFTCLTIRAVHIEVVHSLDTDSFLLALRRFIARRGQVEEIRSDNGTNFTSGERELRESIQAWNHDKINEAMLQKNIKWSFNPPYGSHHGSVWERCIRSVRRILRALLQEQTTDDEGLSTLMCEVESILNSRPLTVFSDDPRDSEPLTPNHLLLLKSDSPMPPGTFQRDDLFSRRRWRQIQYLADIFWKRWSREYLPLLQSRQKWLHPRRNLTVGDVVLVAAENTNRNYWPLGRIQQVFPDKKGFVRKVRVKVKSAVLERPVDKLVLLVEKEESKHAEP